jgi:hypothetical protein
MIPVGFFVGTVFRFLFSVSREKNAGLAERKGKISNF